MSSHPTPVVHPEPEYLAALGEGRFRIQRSRSSGAFVFYPRAVAPQTGTTDLEWVDASGTGVVYSTTVIRQKPPTPSYNLALIDLSEGPRLLSRVEGIAPEQVHIGMAVKAKIVQENGKPLLVFEPA